MLNGGLRCKGIWKEDSNSAPLITYITVVLNSVKTIEKCIQSVISQKNANFEYIIVDGASSDGTLDIIRKYEDKIDYYISEEDNGIYNAMNKGIRLSRGSLICFMNSDDECLVQAAETVTGYFLDSRPDIICGNRILKQKGIVQDEILFKRFPIKHCCFRYIQMFHQSTYATRALFENIGSFDEKYALLSDWIWESKAIDADSEICFIDEKLSVFNNDGASFTGCAKRDREWLKWIKTEFPFMSGTDAWLLLNCLDRDRHPFVEMRVIKSVAQKYASDIVFIKAVYETSLSLVIEKLEELTVKFKAKHFNLEELFKEFKIKNSLCCNSISEVENKLINILSCSINGDICEREYAFINAVRKFEISAGLYYMKNIHIRQNGLRNYLILIIKRLYLFVSFISGKSVLLSALFIAATRNAVALKFSHRILQGKKWKQI